ncbi:hypothetical protein [Mitsuaria sp. GD03876]|uniref:hypothetical protein n=1 Tax=Mitsuaria sp. GD03876 TaxID=2975399 RepID=UPI00244BAE37|nr:hypothetical protein [Mitsuaria sp. GD03876]MDH0866756.1 hypothetical protein [Mitsuaria sp. GD03876]
MTTQPSIPDDEAPLNGVLLERVLTSLPPGVILVGGQALGFWMNRFGIPTEGAAVTADADVIGSVADAQEIARRLRARIELPRKTARTSLVAQVRIPTTAGREGNVDVLHLLFAHGGLRKCGVFTRRVIAGCLSFDLGGGHVLRVMDPFDVLESRIHNLAGLRGSKGDHVETQARWGIQVAKAALFSQASGNEEFASRVGAAVQRLFHLAKSAAGRKAFRLYGIDVLEAIDADLLEAIVPACARQLDGVRSMQAERRTGEG